MRLELQLPLNIDVCILLRGNNESNIILFKLTYFCLVYVMFFRPCTSRFLAELKKTLKNKAHVEGLIR